MISSIRKDKLSIFVLTLFAFFTLWWIILNLNGTKGEQQNYLFGALYGTTISFIGGIVGLVTARQWGGLKSVMGKAIIFLSFGLLAQTFGQVVNSFYNLVLNVEVLYPSLGDLGFFGSIPLYFIGIILLARASGIKISKHSFFSHVQTIAFPATLLSLSYVIFLRDYQFDWSKPLTVFLDLGYPLGQAAYVSIALLTYNLSRNTLGGIMRNRIIFLLAAFVVQYAADFTFLFYNIRSLYFVGGIIDYLYLIAYTLMALGLLQLKSTAREIHHSG